MVIVLVLPFCPLLFFCKTNFVGGANRRLVAGTKPVRIVESSIERPLAVELASSRVTTEMTRKKGKVVANPSKCKDQTSPKGEPSKKKGKQHYPPHTDLDYYW